MPENKIYVQKLGQNLFRVPLDTLNKPVPVSTHDEMPTGCFPMTLNSEAELRAMFPSAEFIYLTTPTNNNVIVRDAEISRKAQAILEQLPTPPTKTNSVAVANDEPLLSQPTQKQKCEEFLKRLQTALQYTSKKHEKKLQDQIAVVEELIREIF